MVDEMMDGKRGFNLLKESNSLVDLLLEVRSEGFKIEDIENIMPNYLLSHYREYPPISHTGPFVGIRLIKEGVNGCYYIGNNKYANNDKRWVLFEEVQKDQNKS